MAKEVSLSFKRSDGQIFDLDSTIWGVRALDGFDFPKVEIYTSAYASGIGEAITGMRTSGRVLDIGITRKIMEGNGTARRALIKFFNSSYTFDLFCTYLGTEVALRDCYISASTLPTVNAYGFLSLDIQLSSGCPYFENADGVVYEFSEIFHKMEFPLEFASKLTEYKQGKTLYFNNTREGKLLEAELILGSTVQNIDGTTLAPASILGLSSPFNVMVNGVGTSIASGSVIRGIGSDKNLLNITDLEAVNWYSGQPSNIGNGIMLYAYTGAFGTGVKCKATIDVGVQYTLSAFVWFLPSPSFSYDLSDCSVEITEWNSDYSEQLYRQFFPQSGIINVQFTCYRSKYIKVNFAHSYPSGYGLMSLIKIMLPQLEIGAAKTPYEMSALGAYAAHDYISKNGSSYSITKMIEHRTFVGTESWVSGGGGKFTLSGLPPLNISFEKHGMSNRMLWLQRRLTIAYHDRTVYVSSTGVCTVSMLGVDTSAGAEASMTLAQFKTWLAANPLEICYVSTSTETIALPAPAQAALNSLRTKELSTAVTTSCSSGANGEIGFLATYNADSDVKKLEFSELTPETSLVIENNGDYEKGAYFEILALGSFTNPFISINNRHSFAINGTINTGQKLMIDFENYTVFVDSIPRTSWIRPGDSFANMKLAVGENTIFYGADSGTSNMRVTVSFNEFLGGV